MISRRIKILFLILVLILVFGVIFFVLSNRKTKDQILFREAPDNETVNEIDKKNDKKNEPDPIVEENKENKNEEQYNLAIKTTNISVCKQILDARVKNLCFGELALLTANLENCRLIDSDQEIKDCQDSVRMKKAESGNDLKACLEIQQPMLQKTCVQGVAAKDFKNADCQVLNQEELKNSCLSEKYLFVAKAEKKEDNCFKIPNPYYKANCLSEIRKVSLNSDADKDSLNFLKEIINGTDPNKFDTDGDGFSDGVEVKKNYNPVGQGSLNREYKCDGIEDGRIKLACLAEFPNKTINFSRCGAIKDWNLKKYCEEQAKLGK